jgi:hypothetical protein
MEREYIEQAMGQMTQEQLLATIPRLFDELSQSLPLKDRAEFNVVRIKLERAIASGDTAAIKALQDQYNAHEDPTKPKGPMNAFFNLFKNK